MSVCLYTPILIKPRAEGMKMVGGGKDRLIEPPRGRPLHLTSPASIWELDAKKWNYEHDITASADSHKDPTGLAGMNTDL